MSFSSVFNSVEAFLTKLGSFLQAPLLLVVRLYWGWGFAQAGWGKLSNIESTVNFFGSIGLPAPKLNAIAAGSTELIAGVLLALGLFTRFAAAALTFTMMVAYVAANPEALRSLFADPDKFTEAAPFLFLYAALIVFAFGPGKASLDALLRKK